MTWRFVAAAIAMILAVGANPGAQAKPDFSGKWVAVDPLPAAGNAGAAGRGGRGGAAVPASSQGSAPSSP